MKVHLIKKQSVLNFAQSSVQSKKALGTWLNIVAAADWEKPVDIVVTFKTADILGNGSERVVFNIGGNKYRMICAYKFGENRVHLFVKWIGTHADYTKLCNARQQYTVNVF